MKNRRDDQEPAWFSLHSLRFKNVGLKGKLVIALVPTMVLILICTGLLTYRVSEEYITIAIERNVILRDRAMAREMELFLDHCRRDVLYFARGRTDSSSLRDAFERLVRAGDCPYFEFGYIPAEGDGYVQFIRMGDDVRSVESSHTAVSPAPALYLDRLSSLATGEVMITGIIDVRCPVPEPGLENRVVSRQVVRLVTPAAESGLMFMSVTAEALRNILSLYNSKQSPLWAFPRSDEIRYAYAVDTEGWMLFQSDGADAKTEPLETYTARRGYEGTLGRPGHGSAFRPGEHHEEYWSIIEKIRNREFGKNWNYEDGKVAGETYGHYLAYSPITFKSDGVNPEVYAGLIYIDRSRLPIVAGYQYLDVMIFVSIATIVFITLFIYFMGRVLTDPIRVLAQKMEAFRSPDELEEIHLGYFGKDIEMLCRSINGIIKLVRKQLIEIRQKDEAILSVNKRERAVAEMHEAVLEESRMSLIPEIVGTGPVVAELKSRILKAAQTDVDVLVIGETGTGKQLVAEAVHSLSGRKSGPFISINCGALDENLLLDALFGHVKGAFTEARSDRNGAFSEADGGTLFLDEIQVASPKVQQSLLRALSMRTIKPLGSDKEISVDVRIIAATNVDLLDLIDNNTFREDLYYRLKVLSINTPPLRSHPESIPVLALCYLHQAESLVNRSGLGFSNGALYKLAHYNWPGNVRELVNCVTRAAVMADGEVIQEEEIRLEGDSSDQRPAQARTVDETMVAAESSDADLSSTEKDEADRHEGVMSRGAESLVPSRKKVEKAGRVSSAVSELNVRQAAGWKLIQAGKSITRNDYQQAAGGIPSRTAIHDLQNMIKLGLIVKTGKGPATRYVLPSEA